MKTSSASTRSPLLVDAELEFRVGDDDSLRQGVVGGAAVGRQGEIAQLVGALGADHVDHVGERDVLVVFAELGLGGRGEQRRVELAGLGQAGRQRDAADLAGLLVVQQIRTRSGSRARRTRPGSCRACAPPARGRALRRGCAGRRPGRRDGSARWCSRRRTRSSRSGCGPCRGSRCRGCSRRPRCGRWRRTAGGRRRCGRARGPCRWPDARSQKELGASGQPSGRSVLGSIA